MRDVVHPPVDVDALPRPRAPPRDYYLVLGRLVPYKRADLAVAACAALGRPVKVVGDGRARCEAARAAAGPGAEFLGRVPDDELVELLAGARALLFPGEEDFGIVPGRGAGGRRAVIAYGGGGVRDSVIDGRDRACSSTSRPSRRSRPAILELEGLDLRRAAIRANARRFGPGALPCELTEVVSDFGRSMPAELRPQGADPREPA